MSKLLVNLSFLLDQPTGLSIYGTQIYPFLKEFDPLLLTKNQIPNFQCYPIPNYLTAEKGAKGHFNRLVWTQFQVPQIYHKVKGSLFFSPIPEAPLYQGVNHIVMVHDLIPIRYPKKFSPLTPYFKYYIPAVLNQAKHLICNSQATANDIMNFWGIPSSKITPILLGYNAEQFKIIEGLQPPEKPYFIYIGRPDPHKNVRRIIEAFANFRGRHDCDLLFVGAFDVRYTPSLKQLSQDLGVEDSVRFLNYIESTTLPLLLNQALGLVFPSLWEGFGFPVLEAMACGTPVITSNCSSLPEVAGDCAILVNPLDVSHITQGMDDLYRDEKLRQTLRDQGLQRVKKFSWSKTGENTVNLLKHYL